MELPVVLVVDDDLMLLRSYVRLLASSEYEVVSAASVKAARILSHQLGDRLRMLVTDLHLMDGLGTELALEMQKHHEGLEVLILTGDPETVEGFDVLNKPFEIDDLRTIVSVKVSL